MRWSEPFKKLYRDPEIEVEPVIDRDVPGMSAGGPELLPFDCANPSSAANASPPVDATDLHG